MGDIGGMGLKMGAKKEAAEGGGPGLMVLEETGSPKSHRSLSSLLLAMSSALMRGSTRSVGDTGLPMVVVLR